MKTTVTIEDGRINGYLTVEEFAAKNNVSNASVRALIKRKRITPLTIGSGNRCTNFIPEDYDLGDLKRGRPKKED